MDTTSGLSTRPGYEVESSALLTRSGHTHTISDNRFLVESELSNFHLDLPASCSKTESLEVFLEVVQMDALPLTQLTVLKHSRIRSILTPTSAEGKRERKSIYISPFCIKVHTKRSGMESHSFTCKQHHACLSFLAFTRCHHHSN